MIIVGISLNFNSERYIKLEICNSKRIPVNENIKKALLFDSTEDDMSSNNPPVIVDGPGKHYRLNKMSTCYLVYCRTRVEQEILCGFIPRMAKYNA